MPIPIEVSRRNAMKQRKLTEPQVRLIKRIIALEKWMRARNPKYNRQRPKGMRVRLAAKFGVTVWCIKRIIDNRNYRSIRVDIHPERRNKRAT